MSLHQNSFSEVLALADIRGHLPAHSALVGLQPAMLDDYGGSLSELAREQLPAAEQAALAQLAAWGIVPQPANESRCLTNWHGSNCPLRNRRRWRSWLRGELCRNRLMNRAVSIMTV